MSKKMNLYTNRGYSEIRFLSCCLRRFTFSSGHFSTNLTLRRSVWAACSTLLFLFLSVFRSEEKDTGANHAADIRTPALRISRSARTSTLQSREMHKDSFTIYAPLCYTNAIRSSANKVVWLAIRDPFTSLKAANCHLIVTFVNVRRAIEIRAALDMDALRDGQAKSFQSTFSTMIHCIW